MNSKGMIIVVLAIAASGLILSGCTTERTSVAGVITEPETLGPGQHVRNFAVVTSDGQSTSFNELREPIAIVAFVHAAGEKCCWLNPDLVSLAGEFRDRPVTVAQISEPTEKCPHGPGCIATCKLADPDLVALCDAEHLAWQAYREPEPGTVMLIDRGSEIVQIANLTDLDEVSAKARALAGELEAFWQSAYEF
jgi:hypothetical protein